jgi:N-acetylglucosamine-6-sulfatase
VVVIMTDDQTLASMQYMPQVNRLIGGTGTTFQHAIATFPLCCPSRSTQLTGQYAHNHGVLHNSGPFGGFKALDHTNTLPVWLQQAGYRTMHVGRYLNGYEARDGIPPGYSDWYTAPHSTAFNYAHWSVNENGTLHSYPDANRPDEYETDYFTRKAIELIDNAAPSEQPFYLQLWYVAPHRGGPTDPDDPPTVGTPSPAPRHRDMFAGVPMPRPPDFDEANMYDKPQVVADRPRLSPEEIAGIEENWRQELETLQAVDEGVAQILGALERTGELNDTLVVFTSDNGFMHGEHRAQAEKVLLYEESVRVPLLMRGPGIPQGRRDDRLVGNIDIAPTILDLARADPCRPRHGCRTMDGRSLMPLLRGHGRWPDNRALLTEYREPGLPRYSTCEFAGIRTRDEIYVEHYRVANGVTGECDDLDPPDVELYNLDSDPFELDNLCFAGVKANCLQDEVQADLERRLARLRVCAGIRGRDEKVDGRPYCE